MEVEPIIIFGSQVSYETFIWIVLAISLWELVWKSIGIYMAAGRGDKWWAVSMVVFNTIGILPIFYIFLFAPKIESMEIKSISDTKTDINISGQ
jgi:hypothetical protein